MPTFLDDQEDRAVEQSTMLISMTFKDEEGVTIQDSDITALMWTLTDVNGTVINEKEDEVISPRTNPQEVLLQGDDLEILAGESGNVLRIFTIEGTYNSTNGSNLPIKDSLKFWVDNLVAVT